MTLFAQRSSQRAVAVGGVGALRCVCALSAFQVNVFCSSVQSLEVLHFTAEPARLVSPGERQFWDFRPGRTLS